jgi:hypothetical protein
LLQSFNNKKVTKKSHNNISERDKNYMYSSIAFIIVSNNDVIIKKEIKH